MTNIDRFSDFSEREKQMISEAVWRRQRCFIAGDRQYNEYGRLLDEVLKDTSYQPGKVV